MISCIILSTDNVAYEIGENLPVALYYEEGDDDYYKEPDKDWEKNTKKYTSHQKKPPPGGVEIVNIKSIDAELYI